MSLQAAKEETTVGEVIGSCWQWLWHAAAFDDGSSMWWHAVACGGIQQCAAGKAGSRGGGERDGYLFCI